MSSSSWKIIKNFSCVQWKESLLWRILFLCTPFSLVQRYFCCLVNPCGLVTCKQHKQQQYQIRMVQFKDAFHFLTTARERDENDGLALANLSWVWSETILNFIRRNDSLPCIIENWVWVMKCSLGEFNTLWVFAASSLIWFGMTSSLWWPVKQSFITNFISNCVSDNSQLLVIPFITIL